ncbi:MAG: hypothetical protein NTW43_06040 [Actinobacteria bacterium]|nr:hypothetical protein [Actinomycetota bacterium]
MLKKTTLSLLAAFCLNLVAVPGPLHAETAATVKTISLGSKVMPVVVGVNGLPTVSNPFDPAQIRVVASISRPDGTTISVEGYWYQEYSILNVNGQRSTKKIGDPYWQIAFSSIKAGTYSLTIQSEVNGVKKSPLTHSVTTDYATQAKVLTSGKSFVRDSRPFVPIAYNIAWANRFEEIEKYDQWFSKASKAGVNVARVWMAAWSLGIEWTDTGLGDYTKRLDRAWILDQVFAIAAKYGIGIDLVLINHGAFSVTTNPEWYSNPYYSSNGGPLASPGEFATNEIAWKFWERRLRYIVARYSAYPSLFTWEWWNEVNFTPISSPDLTSWIKKSNSVLDAWDPYNTLVTSSWSSAASMQNWEDLDYAVTHVYDPADPIKSLTVQADALRSVVPNKPILVGEMGSGSVTEDPFVDPTGLHLHNAQWAATFVGFAGPASYWWWDNYIDPLGLWPHTTGLTKLIKDLDVATMQPMRAYGIPFTTSLTLTNQSTTIGWIRHNNFDRSAKTQLLLDAAILALKTKKKIQTVYPVPVSNGGNLVIQVSKAGSYNVVYMNTFTGAVVSRQSVTTKSNSVTIKVPKFSGDLAFRVEAVLG